MTLEEEDPFCVNNSGGLNATVDPDAEAVWSDVPDLVWSADCGGCINGNGVFDLGDAGEGTHTVTVEYDDDLGCSTSASIDIVVARQWMQRSRPFPTCANPRPPPFSVPPTTGEPGRRAAGMHRRLPAPDPGIGAGNYTITALLLMSARMWTRSRSPWSSNGCDHPRGRPQR